MSEAEVDDDRSILNLNEDCWRAVLQHVPVQDLIRTERVSRRWQDVVLTYLRGVSITIDEYNDDKKPNCCRLKRSSYQSFESWTEKLGPSVVATYCKGLKSLAVIKQNCPNIEYLKLKDVTSQAPKQLRRHNLRDNFKLLKRLCLDHCCMPDRCVSEFLADKALEGLKFYCCEKVTGLCFNNLNLSSLKFLEINLSRDFEAKHVIPAFDRLGELTELKFDCISGEFLEGIQCGLDKMSKLEKLDLDDDERMRGECGEQLSRLTRLKHLRLAYQMFDEDVKAITRCCQELVELDLSDCRSMSRESVEPIWRNAGARLTLLNLSQFYDAEDDDIVALIRGCPLLTELTVSGPAQLTRRLPARAARARRAAAPGRTLQLDLSFTNLTGDCYDMLEEEAINERTILDYLNEDCWRAVLQYVPVQDLIRTERASRRWQGVVLTYLQGVHITIVDRKTNNPNTCELELAENTLKSFESWTEKLGPSVVAAYCNSLESLQIIKKNCSNIEAFKFVRVDCRVADELMPYNLSENFKFLQRLTFDSCPFTDSCISQFVSNRALEELELFSCYNVTGLFFNSLNLSKLKCLVLDMCRGLKTDYVLPAVDRLGELTKLTLAYIPYEILEEMQLMLDKMPKLEWLDLYDDLRMSCQSSKPLSRLTRLKHLNVSCQLDDNDVEAVTRCCQELLTLDLQDCQCMTSHSVEALCRQAGARLTSLSLGKFYEAEDDDVLALVRGCPSLTSLVVAGAGSLTCVLPALAAAARRPASPARPARRLRLDLSQTNLTDDCYLEEVEGQYEEMQTEYENLSVILN